MLEIRGSINGKGYAPVFYAEVINTGKEPESSYRVAWEVQRMGGQVVMGKFLFDGWDRQRPVCDIIEYVAGRIAKEVAERWAQDTEK